jgi:hypothetical protein
VYLNHTKVDTEALANIHQNKWKRKLSILKDITLRTRALHFSIFLIWLEFPIGVQVLFIPGTSLLVGPGVPST